MAASDYIDFDDIDDDYYAHRHQRGACFFGRKAVRPVVWTTRDGEEIPVREMEDSHLQNTINYLTRKSFEWQHSCVAARERGVEMGEMILNNRTVSAWLDILINEVKRRQSA